MKAFAITLLMLAAYVLPAQTVTELVVPWKTGQHVSLDLKFAERISIEAWDKKEVSLKAEVTINGGTLDSAHVIKKFIGDDKIDIETDFDEALIPKDYWCDCKGSTSFAINKKGKRLNRQICSEIVYTVYLPAGADLELKTISGDIKIANMKGEIHAESVSGSVEVIVPAKQQADVYLKSVTGRVESSPDLSTLVDGLRPMVSRKLDGKLNGGGKSVHLESVTGDVNLKSNP